MAAPNITDKARCTQFLSVQFTQKQHVLEVKAMLRMTAGGRNGSSENTWATLKILWGGRGLHAIRAGKVPEELSLSLSWDSWQTDLHAVT